MPPFGEIVREIGPSAFLSRPDQVNGFAAPLEWRQRRSSGRPMLETGRGVGNDRFWVYALEAEIRTRLRSGPAALWR